MSASVTPSSLSPTSRVPARPRKRRIRVGRVLFWILIAIIVVYLLFPFYWAVRTSLTPESQMYNTPIEYFPSHPTLANYGSAFGDSVFVRALLNSAIVGGAVTLLSLVIGASAAYALARFNFRGRTFTMYLVLSMTMFPQIAILSALYELIRNFHLYDTLWALILTYMLFTLPFTVWVLNSFFRTLPKELEDAGYVDGASPFQTFYRVMLPLAAPGMVTTGLLALIAAWNEFLYAVTFLQTPTHYTVPLAIFTFTNASGSAYSVPWGSIMAGTVIVTVPLVALVLIFQRRIIAGMTAGAVKG